MAGMLAGAVTVPATQDTYINSVAVTFPPQVDATNFVNTTAGSFLINTTLPFETSNTRNFTNRGSMTGSVGWRFDYAPSGPGLRGAAANFHNHPLGTVTAADGIVIGGPSGAGVEYASRLLIAATNIINQGVLTVGELGLMRLDGTNVNLNRGGLQVIPLTGQGVSESADGSTFEPETAIADIYWGIGERTFFSAPIVTFIGTNVQAVSPVHPVSTPFIANQNTSVIASPARSFVYTNAGEPISLTLTNETGGLTNIFVTTNRYVQVALVSVVDTNFGVIANFTPSEIDTNPFSTITVQLSAPMNNFVTAQDSVMTFYVMDQLASTTNRILSSNTRDYPQTFRPVTHQVSRIPPLEFGSGTGPNGVLSSNTVYGPEMVTNRVEAEFAAYAISANYLSQLQPPVVDASITNIPGRIEINAGTLDMGRARLRSDGLVTIRAKDFLNSTNANMDAWNLAFDLNSASGNLRVQDLARVELTRYGGTMTMWSGLWENQINEVYTNNYAPDATDTNLFVQSPLTNVVNVGIHVFILDASGLASRVPVTTHSFVARNTNHLELANPLSIASKFTIAAERLTIDATNGTLLIGANSGLVSGLTNLLQNFTAVNAPNLKYLTNAGTFFVPNEAHFGDDRPLPYAAFVNRGSIFGTGLFIDSDYFQNSGLLDSFSSLNIETTSGRMEESDSLINGDLNIRAYDFKWRDHFNQTLGAINVLITNSLSDSGAVAPSRFVCGDGFHFAYANPALPPSGDLLGTALETAAPIFSSTDHTWPAADRGATAAGFTNNLALGRLVLSVGFDAEVVFNGTTSSNAIYVDYLEFLGIDLAEVELALRAGPNFMIYFADSNLPAEELDGLLGGRLRWVSDFAGPNSSVDLLVGNQVIKVNRALRNSLIIDSDGDGLANGFDPSPFDPPVVNITLATAAPLTLAVSWQAAAQTTYKVEYTTNQKDWVLLESYTNQTATAAPATVLDQVPPGSPQRYYRVGYKP